MAKQESKLSASAPSRRSPNYPFYSLEDCIGFMELLYKGAGFKEVHLDEAVQLMGHSPTSSTAGRVISSLNCYGLIEYRGTGKEKFLWLSRLSQEMILEGPSDIGGIPIHLLQQAALNDDMINTIWEKWGSSLPPVNTIGKSLVLEFNFSKAGAQRFAGVLVDTYKYSELDKREQRSFLELNDDIKEPCVNVVAKSEKVVSSKSEDGDNRGQDLIREHKLQDYALPLQGGKKVVVLRAPGGLTEDDFKTITDWINILKIGLTGKMERELDEEM